MKEQDTEGRITTHSDQERLAYQNMTSEEKQAFLRESYLQRDGKDRYATCRDFNLFELEIEAINRNAPTSGVILDLGCGNGYSLLSLAKSRAGMKLVGVDFADNLIEGAGCLTEEMASELQTTPEFVCGDAIAFLAEQPDESADAIITERFLLNLPDDEVQKRVVRDIHRILKPGGKFLMCEGGEEGFDGLNDIREKMGLETIPKTHIRNVSACRIQDEEMEAFCGEIGFSLAEKHGFSEYFTISRILHPLMVAPESPKFDAEINFYARQIQLSRPFQPGVGSNTLWVFVK